MKTIKIDKNQLDDYIEQFEQQQTIFLQQKIPELQFDKNSVQEIMTQLETVESKLKKINRLYEEICIRDRQTLQNVGEQMVALDQTLFKENTNEKNFNTGIS